MVFKRILLFFLVLSFVSCSTITEFVNKSKNNNVEVKNEVTEDVISDEVFVVDNDAFIDTLDYDDYYESQLTEYDFDTIEDVNEDSIMVMIQERFDAENSGEAIVEDADVMMDMMDTLNIIPYFVKNSVVTENAYGYAPNFVPAFPDSVYAKRIDYLRSQTTIDLVFNKHVKSFINVYAVTKRDKTERILGLADVYFPLFEETLDKYNMPLELKYLAVVESALNPTAGSHAGAKGLWQFMYSTGKVYGLNVTSLVDDRFDPLKATDAACRHLSDLYNIFDDWFLALAAYNSGTGNVNKAIRRAGGIKNYWAIWPYLPRETRGYVPAFIAVNYIMNYYLEHNISPLDPGIIKTGIDTVTVHQPLAFDQLNEMLSIPMGDIKFFNPQYKAGIIPATDKNPCILVLPEKYVGDYIDNEKQLYEFKTKKGIDKEKLQEEMKKISDRSVHVVKSGENLGSIARRYRVSVKQLQSWNNLKGTTIYPGQKLIVYSSGAPMAQAGNSSPVSRSTTQKIHTVKSGENLSVIAHKYKCTVTNLKDWNNLRSNTIKVGQKLKVYPPADENSYSSTTRNGDYVIHTVKSGENLSVIAQKYKCSISELKDWNDFRSNTIKVGQKLKVYSVAKSSSEPSTTQSGGYVIYTVKAGDNLWDIAKKFDGVTVEGLKKLNDLNSKGSIKVGQKLKIKKAK